MTSKVRVATTSAYHVPGSQRAGASTASQRVARASHHRCAAAAHHDGQCVDLQVRERQRQAASCAHHVPGSQRAGALTASQRQACTHRLRATTTSASMACQWQQARMLSKLYSTAVVASILGFLLQRLMGGKHDLGYLSSIYRLLLGCIAIACACLFCIMLITPACVFYPRIRHVLALVDRLDGRRTRGRGSR